MFKTQKTPLVSTVENAYTRLISYHIAVWFVVLVGLVLQLVLGVQYLLYGLAQISIAVSLSLALVAAWRIITHQPLEKYTYYMHVMTQGLLAALLLPTQAPLYMIVIMIFLIRFIEVIFKRLFRKNIIHPVLLSLLFVHMMFMGAFPMSETMINIFQQETLTLGRIRILFGAYEGLTLGTSALIILGLLWVYLSVTKIIQFKMSMWYLGNLLFAVGVFALLTSYTLWQLFTLLILGYTLFVLVFFIAEPTSTPETDEMMILFPFIAVLLTVWFRLQFGIIEAAVYAVIFAQFITWIIEQFLNRSTRLRHHLLYGLVGVSWVVTITLLLLN